MSENTVSTYRSGERTPHDGVYELVGSPRRTVVHALKAGDVLPYYQGWEVCWILRCREFSALGPGSVTRPRPERIMS